MCLGIHIYLYRVIFIYLTTTGAAKHRALLQTAGVSVLLVEEAGEVTRISLSPSFY